MTPLLRGSFFYLLASFITLLLVSAEGKGLHRQKREWITAPDRLMENFDYTGYESIAKIHSDKANFTKIYYYLSGPGVDQPPKGIFRVNLETGFVTVSSILDREERAFYQLKGVAKYAINGSLAEKEILLNISVQDENDCKPVITTNQVGYVNESSAVGTLVMKVIATDDDKENTANSRISYSIVEQSNTAGMFYINSMTGEVRVRKNTLDRETQDSYKLIIRASDLGGQPGGNTGTGEIVVKIKDINDNIPTLEQESYVGRVEENTANIEVMRIKAVDKDLIYTENWLAVYKIISGNEGGYFTITTDSKTNEGIIMITKPIDYEKLHELNLKVAVHNKATYNFGSESNIQTTNKVYDVKVEVVNQKEGPRFTPTVKVMNISEEQTSIFINKVIGTYAAIDSDTQKIATNVRYAKIRDHDNWLIIDEKTAEIRLNKLPDRESKYLVNGTYYAEIICISNDKPAKTATGTLAIQVEDFNDHCPKLTTTLHSMCLQNAVYITAVDKDEFPNSAPFDFAVIPGKSTGKWKLEPYNETTVILKQEAGWPGTYKVAVEVKDQQGLLCDEAEIMDVVVCTCTETIKSCNDRLKKTSGFGASGILLMLLGLLLLLLVPLLLLFCLCGGVHQGDFKPIPFDTKQQLIAYHTEGQGEDQDVPIVRPVVDITDGTKQPGFTGYIPTMTDLGGKAGSTITTVNKDEYSHFDKYKKWTGVVTEQDHNHSYYRAGAFSGMALSDQFLGEYYSSKYNYAVQQNQQKDSLLVYDYEGQGSPAGSVGCCSNLENNDDLAFLNDLGPKFKTLAEICRGSTLVTESTVADVSVSPNRPVYPVSPSTHTHTNTHTESIRDRDHVNINTNINTNTINTGSSTFVHEERITGSSAMIPKVQVQDKYVIPSPTLLVQQPTMYYAATPMYVVDPKQQMVLVSGTQQAVSHVGHAGLGQGLVQVGGIQGSQGVVLVDRQVGMGGATGQGTTSRTRKVLVVENGSSGGEQVAQLAQGFVQTGQGPTVQSLSVSSRGSTGSHDDALMSTTKKVKGSQRVVVQHKKVSMTERNIESST